jgi:hypothetical protein
MAQSGHDVGCRQGPLSEVKRTFETAATMSANDPKQTSSGCLVSRLNRYDTLQMGKFITPAERDRV